jgi:TPP-dependent pyruvate/acetoin dehydrogenase alpha subunit
VFVCQNNQYSISLPVGRQTAAATLAGKAAAYAIAAERVDGNDALAVHAAVTRAAQHAKNGGGPRFIECVTYRLGPHSSSDDPDRYRSAEEVAEWERRDPIARMRSALARAGRLDADADARLGLEIDDEIARAIARVEGAPAPEVDSLFDDVFARRPWHLEEQNRALATLRRSERAVTGNET